MAFIEISIVPLGTGSTSLGAYVAEVEKYLGARNIPHVLTDMGTIVEGDLEELWPIIREIHEIPFQKGVKRVYTVIKIDDRRDKEVRLGSKTQSVKNRTSGAADLDS